MADDGPSSTPRELDAASTRWTSGGVIRPADGGTHYESSRGAGATSTEQAGAPSSPWGAGAIPRAARRHRASARSIDASNVGFRMLQKAGWKEGEGLGKHGSGATEPLVVFKKRTRRGVGGESGASRVVVGEGEPDERPPGAGGGKPSAAAAAAGAAGAAAGAAAETPAEDPASKTAREAREARDKAIARTIFRAFKDEGPSDSPDVNPLVRRRREREDAAERGDGDGVKRRRPRGVVAQAGMSANNPLRGMF